MTNGVFEVTGTGSVTTDTVKLKTIQVIFSDFDGEVVFTDTAGTTILQVKNGSTYSGSSGVLDFDRHSVKGISCDTFTNTTKVIIHYEGGRLS